MSTTIDAPDHVSRLQRAGAKIFIASDGRLRAFWRAVLAYAVIRYGIAELIAPTLASAFTTFPSFKFEIAYRSTLAILVVIFSVFLLRKLDGVEGDTLQALGLKFDRAGMKDALLGMLLGAAMIAVAVALIALLGHVHLTRTVINVHTGQLAAAVLAILISGALAEELMFRGYPFQRLLESVGAVAAVAFLSLLFGAAHLGNPGATVWSVVDTALVGVLFAVAYLRTRSLWLPFGMHFAWNATLGLVFGLPVSGLNSFSVIIRSRADGPVWLTGGSYGIEASATGAFVILIGLGAVLWFVPARHEPRPTALEATATAILDDSPAGLPLGKAAPDGAAASNQGDGTALQ